MKRVGNNAGKEGKGDQGTCRKPHRHRQRWIWLRVGGGGRMTGESGGRKIEITVIDNNNNNNNSSKKYSHRLKS